MFANISIAEFDPELAQAISNEDARQEAHIELIASENYCSPAVMEAQGSKLTNKYAEGYPGKRYYGGCEYVDVIEQLAIDRAKELFGADYANVQPHAGSQANSAVYLALLNPGDTVLGMSLAHGGHLTHGAKVSFSGKTYNAIQYGLNPETGEIDYEEVERLALEHKPRMIVAGFSAYSQIVDWQRFREIADKVGAYLFVDMAHVAGLVAAGVYPSPVQIADVTTTTTHKTLRGPRSGLILAKANEEIEKKLQSAVFPGNQGGPLVHAIAAKAICFKEAMAPEYKAYQQQVVVNAKAMAEVLMLFVGVQCIEHVLGNRLGRAVEYHLTFTNTDHPREMRQRQLDGMQACHQGHAVSLGMAIEQGQAVIGQHRVHGRHRLVGQQHLRPLIQRAGNAHPLQLATRQLPTLHEQLVGQAQLGQHLARTRHIAGV